MGFQGGETRGWRVGIIREFIIRVVKLKWDYMIMTSGANSEKINGHKVCARKCKINGLAGNSATDERRVLRYIFKNRLLYS